MGLLIGNEEPLRGKFDFAFPEEVDAIIAALEEELKQHPTGVGLAAPQIGIRKRVAIVRYKGQNYNLINSKVIFRQKMFLNTNEACLSFPGVTVNTVRHKSIAVTTVNKKVGHLRFAYPLSVIVEHEIDHLDGVLIFDRQFKGGH